MNPTLHAIPHAVTHAIATPPTVVERNGYTYRIDGAGRTTAVTGPLTLARDRARSRSAQLAAGGAERRPTDDGGHYIAARFDGPTARFNHFAQDARCNRGVYRLLESQWAAAASGGDVVIVDIAPAYVGASQRPIMICVTYAINGEPRERIFANTLRRDRRGRCVVQRR